MTGERSVHAVRNGAWSVYNSRALLAFQASCALILACALASSMRLALNMRPTIIDAHPISHQLKVTSSLLTVTPPNEDLLAAATAEPVDVALVASAAAITTASRERKAIKHRTIARMTEAGTGVSVNTKQRRAEEMASKCVKTDARWSEQGLLVMPTCTYLLQIVLVCGGLGAAQRGAARTQRTQGGREQFAVFLHCPSYSSPVHQSP